LLRLYDTLTKTVQEIEPITPNFVKMYTCGPTVYRDAHIGNLRSYLLADWIKRSLIFQGVSVLHVKNITDVGHMRQEVLELGGDKIIAAALAEGKTPAQIAQFYTDRFLSDESKMNILPVDVLPKATDHIDEMLEIIERLMANGLAYEVQGNIYFEVDKFGDYGKLSGNIGEAELLEAVRVEADPLKKDPRDFTLWKKAETGRDLKWPSKWGDGFPGWHIECSAMSLKYLDQTFDIHTGGVDNIFPHHEGEIAQSEGFTGNQVVGVWTHGQHLLADGVKMSKSMGNSFILDDIENEGIDPLAFRYLCLTAKYRSRLNFTFNSLKASQRGLARLRNYVWQWNLETQGEKTQTDHITDDWNNRFLDKINDDLDMPGALALTWELVGANIAPIQKLCILRNFDQVLALDLDRIDRGPDLPQELANLDKNRNDLRQTLSFQQSDTLRNQIGEAGWIVHDTKSGSRIRPKTAWEKREEQWHSFSSSVEVPSFIDEESTKDISIAIVACNYMDDVKRCIESALARCENMAAEVVVVDNGSRDGTGQWLEQLSLTDSRIRVIHTDHVLGEGAAKSILLKQCLGQTIVMLDTSVEISGDIYTPIEALLNKEDTGVVGPFGLRTDDFHHFHDGEGESGEMDAMQAYCFAFRRIRLKAVGLPRETFRFYRNLDLDYSFQFKDNGFKVIADADLPVTLHEHRVWTSLAEGERDELSKKNYGRFLDKWGERSDLLTNSVPHSH